MIRPIAGGDFDRWLPLWHGYLHFYRAELTDEVTRATFDRPPGGGQGVLLTQEFNGPARSLYDRLATRVSFVVYERDLPGPHALM